jgi:GT2 family glycosyltransferase
MGCMDIKITVVGLCFNGKDLMKPFIDSIYASSLKEVEVIIVDNDSSDGSVQYLRKEYPKVKVIARKDNLGSGAHNDAIPVGKGEYFLFTDCDMIFEKDCLKNFYDEGKRLGKKVVLGPTIKDYDTGKKLESSYSVLSRSFYAVLVKAKDNTLKQKEVFMAGFPFLHRDTIKDIGYVFDNDFFLYAEDFDFCLRLRLLGYKMMTCPTAVMRNKPLSETTRKYLSLVRLTYLMERNLITTMLKVCRWHTVLLYLPYVLVMRDVAIFRDLISLKPKLAWARIKALWWNVSHFGSILKRRRREQRKRRVSDRKMFSIADEGYFLKSLLGF